MRFRLSLIITCLFVFTLSAGNDPVTEKTKRDKNVFGERAFIENKGQFYTPAIKEKILYAYDNGDEKVYFTGKGLVYEISDVSSGKNQKEYVFMNWKGSRMDMYLEAKDKESYYYTYGPIEFNSAVYKKLIFKNVYPHIDVEYIFPEDKDCGVEYNFILEPGANINDIKIAYTGSVKDVRKNEEGNIIVKTAFEDIVEHAPHSFYLNNEPVKSGFKVDKQIIGFYLEGTDDLVEQAVVIDPWVVNTSTTSVQINAGFDVDFDNNHNTYVYGGRNAQHCRVAKYSAGGSLLWVFAGQIPPSPAPAVWTSGGPNKYAGNFVVDRQNQIVYMGQPRTGSGTQVAALNSSGNYNGFMTPVMTRFDEIWDMTYNCNTGQMYVFGGSTTSNPNSSNPIGGRLNIGGTKIDTVSLYLNNGNHSIANHAIDESGNLFAIFGDGSSTMKNYISRFDKNFTQSIWKTNSGFTALNGMSTRSNYVVTLGSMAYNCLAVNNYYLFYYDGVHLAAYNKITGASMGSRTLTHLTALQQGGIAVDDCNNVYIGGKDSILCFNFSYTYSTSTGSFTPGTGIGLNLGTLTANKYVYDIKFERGPGVLHYSGSGFVGQTHAPYQTCHRFVVAQPNCSTGESVITFTDDFNILNSFTYTSIVTPTLELSYTWVDLSNSSTVYTVNGAVNSNTYGVPGNYNVQVGPVGSCFMQNLGIVNYPVLNCAGSIIASNGFIGLNSTATNVFTVNTCLSYPMTFTGQCSAMASYTWNFGDATPTVTGVNQSHTYSSAGTYSLVITAQSSPSCASITQTYVVNVVNCAGSGTTSCCSNMTVTGLNGFNSTTFTASICPFSNFTLGLVCPAALLYTVNFGDGSPVVTSTSSTLPSHIYSTPGTYDLSITANGPGCSTVKTLTVTSFYSNACPPCCTNPFITTNGSPFSQMGPVNYTVLICPYGKLEATASCSAATSYTWDFGDGSSTYVGATIPPHVYNPATPQYTMLTKAKGTSCYQELTSIVMLNEMWCAPCCAAIGLTGGGISSYNTPTASGCPLKAFNLSAGCTSSNFSPSNYTLNFGAPGGLYVNSTSGTYNQSFMYTNPGTYSITLRQTGPTLNNKGCVSNSTLTFVANYSLCSACCSNNFVNGAPSNQCLVSAFSPTINSNCPGGLTYSWNFGDNTTGSGSTVSHFYASPGPYTVSVLATGSNSCASTQSIPITVSYSTCPSCCGPGSSITINGTGLQHLAPTATANVFKADVCITTPINLNASNCSGASTYTWNFGDGPTIYTGASAPQHYYANQGNYSLVVSGFSSNCYQTQTIIVTVSGSNCATCCQPGFMSASGSMTVSATLTPSLFTAKVCPSKSFTITASCPNATAYAWSGTGGLSGSGPVLVYTYFGQSASVITYTARGPNCYTTFTINADVSYTNCPPCCTVAPFVGTGFQYLNTVNPNTQFAGGTCPTGVFNLTAAGCTPGNVYNWDFGDGTSQATSANVSHQYNTPGVYTLTMSVLATTGCYQSMTLTVDNSSVNCAPCCQSGFVTGTGLNNLTATGTPNLYTAYACIGSPINLSASGCAAANSYTWDFGNGSSIINTVGASGQYNTAGNYTILVKASGPQCLAPTQTICVTVSGLAMIMPTQACTGKILLAANICTLPGSATYNWDFGDGSSSPGGLVFHNYGSAGIYTIQLAVTVSGSPYATYSQTIQIDPCAPPDPCQNCIGSFAPEAGEYILNAWVREDINPIPTSYSNAKIQISFTGTNTVYTFTANPLKNKVIEGWQRIEEPFTIPVGVSHLNLKLLNAVSAGGPDAFFDDIRIFPKDGQMKTFVYDPITLKLSAILDENNYATFYEYDEEGKLIRVKKETERGVMTIQESRESLKRQ